MKKALLHTENNVGGTSVEVSATIFPSRSREFEVRLGFLESRQQKYSATVVSGMCCVFDHEQYSPSKRPGIRVLSNRGLKEPFSLLNVMRAGACLSFSRPSSLECEPLGDPAVFLLQPSLQQVVMGLLYKHALCEFSSVITRFSITFVSRDKYNKYKNFESNALLIFFCIDIFRVYVYKIYFKYLCTQFIAYSLIYFYLYNINFKLISYKTNFFVRIFIVK